MPIAYRCALCKHLHRERSTHCRGCRYPTLHEATLTAQEFCAQFGHDSGEMRVSDTAKFERTEFVPLEEDACTIGGSDARVYSHEYLFRCARCGHERRTRK